MSSAVSQGEHTSCSDVTLLDFLRHGACAGGAIFRGSRDDALSESGWKEMHARCAGRSWQALASSPLRRCRSFASAWRDRHDLVLGVDAKLSEYHFGDWEGQSAEQIERLAPGALERFYADPFKHAPPGSEAYADFRARVGLAVDELLAAHRGQTVLVVTHAGVIRTLFSLLLGLSVADSWRIHLPHAALTRFRHIGAAAGGGFFQLDFHLSE